ncbi:hypothetical protein pb186bvf_020853 [Paramecium bursaria]
MNKYKVSQGVFFTIKLTKIKDNPVISHLCFVLYVHAATTMIIRISRYLLSDTSYVNQMQTLWKIQVYD